MFNSWILDHYDMLKAGQLDRGAMEKIAHSLGGRLMTPAELDLQTDDGFGLILVASASRMRRYPMTSPAETVMSKVAFYMTGASLPKEAQLIMQHRLSAAHERFGISADGTIVKEARVRGFIPSNVCVLKESQEQDLHFQAMAKTASAMSESYAINQTLNGEPFQKYPMNNQVQVGIRIERFESLRSKLAAKYAFEYAENVIRRAAELDVDISPTSSLHLYKSAALNPHFKDWVAERVAVAPVAGKAAYISLMSKVGSADPRALAIALDTVDRSYGLDNYYGIKFPDAVSSTISMEKQAMTFELGTLVIDTEDVTRLIDKQRSLLEAFLDNETIDRMRRDPERVIKALPAPHKQMLLDVLNSSAS